MKTCFRCKRSLPLDELYRHPGMADGHLGKCKLCACDDTRRRYRLNHSEKRAYDKRREATPRRREQKKTYLNSYRRRHPEKARARQAVARALRAGTIKRGPCEVCGSSITHAHHPDYSLPLFVRWLCVIHHTEAHGRRAA